MPARRRRPRVPLRDAGARDAHRRGGSARGVHAARGRAGPHRGIPRGMTWQLALTGLLVGTLVGMTGMGGGSLMTPILVLLWGVSPTVAIGSDIAHGASFATGGAVPHRRR